MLISMIATTLIDRPGIFAMEGERLNVTPIQAAMLKYQKLARFATKDDAEPEPPPPPPEPEPPPIAAKATRPRRTYRRRDMTAER